MKTESLRPGGLATGMRTLQGLLPFYIYICPLRESSLKHPAAKEEAAAPGALPDRLLSPSPASAHPRIPAIPQGLRVCPIPAFSQSGVGEPLVPGIPGRSWRWGAKPGGPAAYLSA